MSDQKLKITVYGSDEPCPGCLHSPSSIETKEWLEAALQRKYQGQAINIRYVDIYNPVSEKETAFSQRVIDEDFIYPVVVMNEEVVAEGSPRLKPIFHAMERYGYKASS